MTTSMALEKQRISERLEKLAPEILSHLKTPAVRV